MSQNPNHNPSQFHTKNGKPNPNLQPWPYSYEELLNDYLETPECLETCMNQYFTNLMYERFQKLLAHLENSPPSKIVFIGNTFNYFASFIPRYCLMKSTESLNFSWECYELTEFYDYMLPKTKTDTLYIFISKSGQSRYLLKTFEYFKMIDIASNQLWLVTNSENTPIAKQCKEVFLTHVQSELVLGLKSFQNTITVLYILAQLFLGINPITEHNKDSILSLVKAMKRFRESRKVPVKKILQIIKYQLEFLYFISRDPASLACAKLSALRVKTYHRQFAEGISFGLFFHGPFQIFESSGERNLGAILLLGNKSFEIKDDSQKSGSKNMFIRLVHLIRERAGKVIILTNNPSIRNLFTIDEHICIVDFQADIECLAPIFENFILALVFLEIAKRDGLLG